MQRSSIRSKPSGQVILAPDKFKGTLTAREAAAHLAAGLHDRLPDLEFRELPVADGGDGTLEAAISAGFRAVPVRADGPTGQPVDTAYAERDGLALVELAAISGLGRLPGHRLDPLHASSYGTGQLVRAALDAGAHTVVIGLGGSACTDGGAGLVQALGVRLLDQHGAELPRGGAALAQIDRVEAGGLHPPARAADVVVISDVDNPLLGRNGAARVYGPQKGASPEQVELLESALARWAQVLDPGAARLPGAGAAGGVAFGALALLGASVRRGIEYLLELVGFPEALTTARMVITGEGSLDEQTLNGKAPAGVASLARQAGVPVVAVAGRVALARAQLQAAGFAEAYALTDIEPDTERCASQAGPLLERLAAERVAPLLIRGDESAAAGPSPPS